MTTGPWLATVTDCWVCDYTWVVVCQESCVSNWYLRGVPCPACGYYAAVQAEEVEKRQE